MILLYLKSESHVTTLLWTGIVDLSFSLPLSGAYSFRALLKLILLKPWRRLLSRTMGEQTKGVE
jgi:hypothetical protein